ncbi:MAG: phospholipase D-like domain-containing protein [Caulobacteraceae bacterium]
MIGFELLVGSEAFWERAQRDIASARHRLFVQAMSFEGDRAGLKVAAAIAGSGASERRVLVDAYSTLVLSDRFVLAPASLLDPAARAEARATRSMFARLRNAGVKVRLTNPVGPFLWRYPARNHRKLILADDVVHLGGINFSDHNFTWADFMLRIEGAGPADFLASDFSRAYESRSQRAQACFGPLRLIALDGRTNAEAFLEVIALIEAAASEITVMSPYLTFPFIAPLSRAAARGVRVRLVTPSANNKPLVRDAMLFAAAKAGFETWLTPGMSHFKGLLLDRRRLVLGSANFDFVSWSAEEELIAVIDDVQLARAFEEQIVAPALVEASRPSIGPARAFLGLAGEGLLRLASLVALAARGSRRGAVDWPP